MVDRVRPSWLSTCYSPRGHDGRIWRDVHQTHPPLSCTQSNYIPQILFNLSHVTPSEERNMGLRGLCHF